MREVPFTSKLAFTEDKQPLALDYFILASDSEPERYGVKILEKNSGEQAMTFNVTMSIERIYELMDKLSWNSITPTCLTNMLSAMSGRG